MPERWSWPCPVSTQQQLLQRLGIFILLRYMLEVVYEQHVHFQMRSYLFEFTSGNYSWHIQMSNCHLLLLLALARWVAAPAGLGFLRTPQQAQQTFGMKSQVL